MPQQKVYMMARLLVSVFFFNFLFSSSFALDLKTNLNVNSIEKITAHHGYYDQSDNSFKIQIPRNDLNIIVNGMKVTPEMGLTSRVSFKKEENTSFMSGDLILSQDQVNPVLSVALANNIEVTDLSSPFLWDSPRVMSMHIKAEGNEKILAFALSKILIEMNKTIDGKGDFPLSMTGDTETDLNVYTLNSILGTPGLFKGGVYKVSFANRMLINRNDSNKLIAKNTWAAFSGSNDEALMDGIVAVRAAELQGVLKALRHAQIYVLAIYPHNIEDDSNFIFVHFWGMGTASSLAKAYRNTFAMAQSRSDVVAPVKVASHYARPIELVQNNTCVPAKRWIKDLYPQTIETNKVVNVTQTKSTGIGDIISSQLTSVINKIETRATPSLEKYFIVFLYKVVNTRVPDSSSHPVAEKAKPEINAVQQTEIHEFFNFVELQKAIKTAFGFTQEISGISISIEPKYKDTITLLRTTYPVIFSLIYVPTLLNEDININTSHYLKNALAALLNIKTEKDPLIDKDYNYLAYLVVHNPFIFPSFIEPIVINDRVYNLVANLLHMPTKKILLDKDYNYLAQLETSNPIVFSNHIKPVIVSLDPILATNHHLKNSLVSAMHVQVPDHAIDLMLTLNDKNYDYVPTLMRNFPVNFPQELESPTLVGNQHLEQAIMAAVHIDQNHSSWNGNFILQADAKDYNYLNFIKTHDSIVFPDKLEKPMIAAQTTQEFSESLANLIRATLRMKPASQEVESFASLVFPVINYHYVDNLQTQFPVVFTHTDLPAPKAKVMAVMSELKTQPPVYKINYYGVTAPLALQKIKSNTQFVPTSLPKIQQATTKTSVIKKDPHLTQLQTKIEHELLSMKNDLPKSFAKMNAKPKVQLMKKTLVRLKIKPKPKLALVKKTLVKLKTKPKFKLVKNKIQPRSKTFVKIDTKTRVKLAHKQIKKADPLPYFNIPKPVASVTVKPIHLAKKSVPKIEPEMPFDGISE